MRTRIQLMAGLLIATGAASPVHALNCLAYLAADEALNAARQAVNTESQAAKARAEDGARAPQGEEEAAREAYRLAIAQAEEAHDAASVVPLAALREAEHAQEAARVHFEQVKDEADHVWLDALNAGDEAGKEAGKEAAKAMREAAGAALREAREAERAARAHYQEVAAQASTTLYATRAAALAELNRFHEAAFRAENNQRQAIRDAFAEDVPLQEAIAAYETARAVAGDAYIAAYENPTPDTWRDTAGYSRTVILKMAVSERQLCPD